MLNVAQDVPVLRAPEVCTAFGADVVSAFTGDILPEPQQSRGYCKQG